MAVVPIPFPPQRPSSLEEKIDELRKIEEEQNKLIKELLETLDAAQERLSRIDSMVAQGIYSYSIVDIFVHFLVQQPWVNVVPYSLKISLSGGETRELTLVCPTGTVCLCPFWRAKSTLDLDVYLTMVINRNEAEMPAKWRDRNVVVDFPIPDHYIKETYPIIPKKSVYVKLENESAASATIAFYTWIYRAPSVHGQALVNAFEEHASHLLDRWGVRQV